MVGFETSGNRGRDRSLHSHHSARYPNRPKGRFAARTHCAFGIVACVQPRERAPEVAELSFVGGPVDGCQGQRLPVDSLREHAEVVGMAASCLFTFFEFVESLERVGADRLEQHEARLATGLLVLAQEVVVDQR